MAHPVHCPAAYRKKSIMLGRLERHPKQASEREFFFFSFGTVAEVSK